MQNCFREERNKKTKYENRLTKELFSPSLMGNLKVYGEIKLLFMYRSRNLCELIVGVNT